MNQGKSSFLGRGWSFPPQFLAQSGEVLMTADEEDIVASLNILLGTSVGERILYPKYGLNLRNMLFEPLSTTAKTLLEDRIEIALLVHEARINVLSVNIGLEQIMEGKMVIEIEYVIQATNSRFNLVYPYYLNDGNAVEKVF